MAVAAGCGEGEIEREREREGGGELERNLKLKECVFGFFFFRKTSQNPLELPSILKYPLNLQKLSI
jgi:hypothetical protein